MGFDISEYLPFTSPPAPLRSMGRRILSREESSSDVVNKRKCCVPFTVASFVSSNTIRGFGVVGGQPKVLTLTYIRPHINIP